MGPSLGTMLGTSLGSAMGLPLGTMLGAATHVLELQMERAPQHSALFVSHPVDPSSMQHVSPSQLPSQHGLNSLRQPDEPSGRQISQVRLKPQRADESQQSGPPPEQVSLVPTQATHSLATQLAFGVLQQFALSVRHPREPSSMQHVPVIQLPLQHGFIPSQPDEPS